MIIRYKNAPPDETAYFELFKTTGWNELYKANAGELKKALGNSWHTGRFGFHP